MAKSSTTTPPADQSASEYERCIAATFGIPVEHEFVASFVGTIGEPAFREIVGNLEITEPTGEEGMDVVRKIAGWLYEFCFNYRLFNMARTGDYWITGIDGPHITLERKPPDLATMPYADYLKTEHWQQVRAEAIERAGGRCQLCNDDSDLHVHHRTYERRGAEETMDVIALCKTCHERFHEVKNGKPTRMPVKKTTKKPVPTFHALDWKLLEVGKQVVHNRFGIGVVQSITPRGDDAQIGVWFRDIEDPKEKLFMAGMAGNSIVPADQVYGKQP